MHPDGKVGILHDIDFEICTGIEDHTFKARRLLEGMVDNELIEAIMAHNHEHTRVPPETTMKKGLIACDAASGLVTASALVTPTKRLADVRPESLVKKFGSKDLPKGSAVNVSWCANRSGSEGTSSSVFAWKG